MFFRSVHYLRAFAAISVVAFHAGGPNQLGAGVDLFFVMSGFVMVKAAGADFSTSRFLTARVIRIYPAWIVAMLLFSGMTVHAPPLRDIFLFPQEQVIGTYIIRTPMLEVGWTLYYEMFFYVIFAGCGGNWRLAAAVLIMLSAAWRVAPMTETNPVLLEFVFGMAIASIPSLQRSGFLVVGLILLALAPPLAHSVFRPLYYGLPAALILSGAVAFEDRIPMSRILSFLGAASYSIYLVHLVPGGKDWSAVLIGIPFGCLFFIAVERPLARLLGKIRYKHVVVRVEPG